MRLGSRVKTKRARLATRWDPDYIYDLWIIFLILRTVARSGYAFKTLACQSGGFSFRREPDAASQNEGT